mgnify:CR=1 FL=1
MIIYSFLNSEKNPKFPNNFDKLNSPYPLYVPQTLKAYNQKLVERYYDHNDVL